MLFFCDIIKTNFIGGDTMQFEKITLKDLNKDIIKKYIKEILYIRNEYNIDDTYIDKVSKILEDFLVVNFVFQLFKSIIFK
jgi:hypothetical protein